jgi:NADPH:quinone reductase-like Zn-dependent oxidoreductase
MKAIAQDEFGPPDVLQLREVEDPKADAHQVLVRVRAASPNPWDWHFMRELPYVSRPQAGWRKPRNEVLGSDVAGHVEAVGNDATRFRLGDEVFGFVGHGAFAENVSVPEDVLALKPTGVSFEQAATVPLAAMTALQGLRDRGGLKAGERVLIVGASGGVGTFAVQIAKAFGAHVTGVCSTRNVELVKSIGADEVIDYTKEDFTQGSEKFD